MSLPRLRFVIPFLLIAWFSVAVDSYVATQYQEDQRTAKIVWKAACRITNYEVCPRKGPAIRRSPIVNELMGALGVYWMGSPVIWLSEPITGGQAWLTILHEQIHYLQYLNDVDSEGFDKNLTCLEEREAMVFTNIYAIEIDRLDLVRSVEVWRDLYKCHPNSTSKIMWH